jgi:hypothetical protein
MQYISTAALSSVRPLSTFNSLHRMWLVTHKNIPNIHRSIATVKWISQVATWISVFTELAMKHCSCAEWCSFASVVAVGVSPA